MLDDETVSESGLFELDNSNDGDEPVAFLHFENSQTGEKSGCLTFSLHTWSSAEVFHRDSYNSWKRPQP